MAVYQCPLQVEVERLQQIANNLKDKAIEEYLNKGWQACYNSHLVMNGTLMRICILINCNVVLPNIVEELIKQGKTIKPQELIEFKKYLSWQLADDSYIIF